MLRLSGKIPDVLYVPVRDDLMPKSEFIVMFVDDYSLPDERF